MQSSLDILSADAVESFPEIHQKQVKLNNNPKDINEAHAAKFRTETNLLFP